MQKFKFVFFWFYLLINGLAMDISTNNEKFANNLYSKLSRKDGNIFFSPISAYIALIIAYQGASGSTAKTLQKTLNLPNCNVVANEYKSFKDELDKLNNVKLYIANNIYIRSGYTLKQDFQSNINNLFMANIQNIDFNETTEAVHEINSWVESKTNNKIKNLISTSDLSQDTRLILINAVYFKGFWKYAFNEHSTHKGKFHISDSNSVDCQMMRATNKYIYTDSPELDAKIIKVPYVNNNMYLLIILPKSRTGIKSLEEKLLKKDLSLLIKNMHEVKVMLTLPKFKIETTMDLKESLAEMGLENLFSNNAEFNNMLNSPEPLTVNKVIQKAYIEIDEKGSEASAATGVLTRRIRSLDDSEIEFLVDRPFLFSIIHANYGIIFFGRLTNPNSLHVHDEL